MWYRRSASFACFGGLLLLLGSAVWANEADNALHRLTRLAREQVRTGDPKALSNIIDEIVKELPHATADGLAAVSELNNDLMAREGEEGREGLPEHGSELPEAGASVPTPRRFSDHSVAPAGTATPEPRRDAPQPSEAPAVAPRPDVAVASPSEHQSRPAPEVAHDTPSQSSTASAAMPSSVAAVSTSEHSSSLSASTAAMASPAHADASQSLPRPVVDLLRRRGDSALSMGDVSAARHFYRRAAEAGCRACSEAMADTYDPERLRHMGVVGVTPDPKEAEAWRARARKLGQTATP